VAAYIQDYMPQEMTVAFVANITNQATFRLERGEIIVGHIEHRRLSLREIEEAGIDIRAPENNFVYEFTVVLIFEEIPLPEFIFMVNGMGNVINDPILRLPNRVIIPRPIVIPGRPPTISFLVINGSVSFLKEFFEVSVIMENRADSQFVLVDNTVTLSLPYGLSR